MSKNVLVVDDDPAIRRVLDTTLTLEGYSVRVASDGLEALDLVENQKPDIVILDVMMPKLDGLAVLEKLRSEPATAAMPVILLTAKSSTQEVWEGWEAGVDYYLTKPFDIEELLKFMQRVLHETKGPSSATDR